MTPTAGSSFNVVPPVSDQPPTILLEGDDKDDDNPADSSQLNETVVVDDEISFHPRPRASQPENSATTTQTGGEAASASDPGWMFRNVTLPRLLHERQTVYSMNQSSALDARRLMILHNLVENNSVEVNIRRHNLVQDVLDFHDNKDNLEKGVTFKYVDEPGVDLDGVKRDVFTLFWRQSRCRFLEGNDHSFVPRATGIPREQYVLIGRILSYGYITAGIFPAFVNRAFMQAPLCGEDSLTDENLLEGILDYSSPYERERLLRLMSSNHLSPNDIDFLLDFAERGGVTFTPTIENVRKIVLEVARTVLINTPMHSMTKIKEGMLHVPGSHLVWANISVGELHQLYSELLPSPEKVTAMLTATCNDQEEERVFSFLRRYTLSLSQEKAVVFLRWVTGSETLTVPNIKVEFHKSYEEEPYPRAHVCGGMLDISSRGYATYHKFKQIMDSVICSEEAFKFSSV